MKTYIIKDYKIIGQADNDYQAKDGEILISANDIDYPILKRTGGQFLEINRNEKQDDDIESGGVTKFKIKRNNQIVIIERSEKLETDELLEFIYPENMIRIYRGGTSILTIATDFDCKKEVIEHTYTKDELYILNGKAKVKTPEMQIKDIQIKASRELLKIKKQIQTLEENKILLNPDGEWYSYNEDELIKLQNYYNEALIDYNTAKQELLENASSIEDIAIAKENIEPILLKYNIKV